MAVHGFIDYDTDAKFIRVSEKLFRYADYKAGTRDFDNISFRSDLKPELKAFSTEEMEQINSNDALRVTIKLLKTRPDESLYRYMGLLI